MVQHGYLLSTQYGTWLERYSAPRTHQYFLMPNCTCCVSKAQLFITCVDFSGIPFFAKPWTSRTDMLTLSTRAINLASTGHESSKSLYPSCSRNSQWSALSTGKRRTTRMASGFGTRLFLSAESRASILKVLVFKELHGPRRLGLASEKYWQKPTYCWWLLWDVKLQVEDFEVNAPCHQALICFNFMIPRRSEGRDWLQHSCYEFFELQNPHWLLLSKYA